MCAWVPGESERGVFLAREYTCVVSYESCADAPEGVGEDGRGAAGGEDASAWGVGRGVRGVVGEGEGDV